MVTIKLQNQSCVQEENTIRVDLVFWSYKAICVDKNYLKEIFYWMPNQWSIIDYSFENSDYSPQFCFTIVSEASFDQNKLQNLIGEIEKYTGFFVKQIFISSGNYSVSNSTLLGGPTCVR